MVLPMADDARPIPLHRRRNASIGRRSCEGVGGPICCCLDRACECTATLGYGIYMLQV